MNPNPHHLLLLQPTDVLFFKDGRPMEGASAGHGAAWPLPNVIDSALHHALRRADFVDFTPHSHSLKRSGEELNTDRENHGRSFGSLQSTGAFPVDSKTDRWFFPRPADAAAGQSAQVTHRPLAECCEGNRSSLPMGTVAVVNTMPPSKDKAENWISQKAFQSYLGGEDSIASEHFLRDDQIFAAEHNIGIGIDPETSAQDGKSFYSASYLRLKPGFRMGTVASCMDKGKGGHQADTDLLKKTFLNSGHQNLILAGGQQRTCTVFRSEATEIPLPVGKNSGFHHNSKGKHLVKWVLLTPAIFPHLRPNEEKNVPEHPGGWLPSWIDAETQHVLLRNPNVPRPERNKGESRADYRRRLHRDANAKISAHLVAAMVGKATPVTGWSLADVDDKENTFTAPGGARATHLAVPAGSVYYFECEDKDAAEALAAALNWHGGDSTPTQIRNRRSTLFGEKGFGLGVCGTWDFHDGKLPQKEDA